MPAKDEMKRIDIVTNNGGGGSGLPSVTAEDNGKTLQVEEGSWQVKNADYTKKTVFFSGNATVNATVVGLG